MKRHIWVLIHCYVGLTMAFFLIVAGLTGSILALSNELDDWLDPVGSHDLTRVVLQTRPMLDPFDLRERALKLMPQAQINTVLLEPKPGEVYTLNLQPRINPATGQPYQLGFDTLKLDPIQVSRSNQVATPRLLSKKAISH